MVSLGLSRHESNDGLHLRRHFSAGVRLRRAAVAGPEAGAIDGACACADGPDAEATEGWKDARIPWSNPRDLRERLDSHRRRHRVVDCASSYSL
jgi:hypothetical protein